MSADSEIFFLPYQVRWITDPARLKIIEKSRQVGISLATAYSAVRRASAQGARYDVWVSSRDEFQARLFIEDCKQWADILQKVVCSLGDHPLDQSVRDSSYVLPFTNGRSIYSLSSNPNALAGKRGHVILDEFALHQDQSLLYRVAQPVTTWGGQLEIISTHRGSHSLFNQILHRIKEEQLPAGWSHHRVTLADAVEQGLVERINARTGVNETREGFLARLRAECVDEAQWLQEYCCTPADDHDAFIPSTLVAACEETDPTAAKDWDYLVNCPNPLYLGVDIGRKHDLTVLDLGEWVDGVMHDRLRMVMANRPFEEQEAQLWRLLELPQLQRACIDATGLGQHLAENAENRFGWKVEKVTFTPALKEKLAFDLRMAFELRRLRVASDPELRKDLCSLRRELTIAGNLRFDGNTDDGHCDRFWALALRQHAVTQDSRGSVASVA